jgi:Double-GTPase 2
MAVPGRSGDLAHATAHRQMNASANPYCSHPHCHVPTGVCAHGEENYLSDCKYYCKDIPAENPPPKIESATEFPWTGSTLGLDDLEWLAARGRPSVFALVGAQNAGKTTFLATIYIGLSRGMPLLAHKFGSAFTLGGWESLAAYMRYRPEGLGPQFPPHTANTGQRVPGLLHFALRGADGALMDALFTDAPGEWFDKWAVNETQEGAAGARWIAKHAEAFLLFVDSEELAGERRGEARDELFKLGHRLAQHLDRRPIAIVWSKSDIDVRPTFRKQLDERFRLLFPAAPAFSVSVRKKREHHGDAASEYLAVVSWLLAQETNPATLTGLPTWRPEDPFFSFRARRYE